MKLSYYEWKTNEICNVWKHNEVCKNELKHEQKQTKLNDV